MAAHQSRHLKENKLSEKMGRRDIQFYDLYKLQKPPSDVEKLQDKGYLLEGILTGQFKDVSTGEIRTILDEDEPIYGDIEVSDFNQLFRNEHLIKEKFGQSISVKLQMSSDGTLSRKVIEDLAKVAVGDAGGLLDLECDNLNEMSCMYSQAALS